MNHNICIYNKLNPTLIDFQYKQGTWLEHKVELGLNTKQKTWPQKGGSDTMLNVSIDTQYLIR